MAGYRPKSLNELNDMYNKTITAEKAIIKATQQLHDATESIVPSESQTTMPQELPKEESRVIEEFSGEVDSLINRFRSETTAPQTKKEDSAAVKMTAPKAEPPKKISFEKEKQAAPKSTPAPQINTAGTKKPVYSLGAPDEVIEKATAKSDERAELFDDYMKIMNDEDDDFFSKRESFKKKDKKKKHKKGLFFRSEPKAEETADEAETLDTDVTAEEAPESPSMEAELPVREVIYTPEGADNSQDFKIEYTASENEEIPAEAPVEAAEDDEEISDFSSEFAPSEESTAEEVVLPDEDEDEEEIEAPAEAEEHPDFDILSEEKEEAPVVPEEIAESTYEDYMDTAEDIFSFDPNKVNTIPEYARDEYVTYDEEEEDEYYEDEDGYGYDDIGEMPKNKKGLVAGRVILGIVFALLLVFDLAVIGINSVLCVNTGKTVLGDKCVFTAESDFVNAGILEGDLIITEQRNAEDGEVFAYINYTQQRFMFGKRSGNIINDIGSELYIAENDGERVLVLRDDTRGVVSATYPSAGKIISICSDNFILILAVALVIQLVIILLLVLVLKDKEKAYKKMMKKMIKKGVISESDEDEYEYTEDAESDNEDLFSSIE